MNVEGRFAPAGRTPVVGDRVKMRDHAGSIGTVIGLGKTTGAGRLIPPGLPAVAVKWDDGWHNGDLPDEEDFYSYETAGDFTNYVIELDVIE